MSSSLNLATSDRPAVAPFAHPLDEFYAQAGRPFPEIVRVQGEEVPEPYNHLLVHQRDMTPTLKAFHKADIEIEVLMRQQRGDFYFREVLLRLIPTQKIVEFGAIKINLALFPAAARRDILEERAPLGKILEMHSIMHASRPKAYLKLRADDFIRSVFKLADAPVLFGRRNTLLDPKEHSIAEIVEILPPA
jgi:chorismate-pyruvate lyase